MPSNRRFGSLLACVLIRLAPLALWVAVLQPDVSLAFTLNPPSAQTSIEVIPGLNPIHGGFDPNIATGSYFSLSADAAIATSTSLAASPLVSENVSLALGSPTTTTADASAQLSWQFSITGPAFSTGVPIIVAGSASQLRTGGGKTGGEVVLQLVGFPELDQKLFSFSCLSPSGPSCAPGGFRISTTATPNSLYDLLIATGGSVSDGGGIAQSEVDPTIMIDPSFPNANLYTLTQNLTVPEPSTMTLFATGLAGIIGLGDKRSRKRC